MGSDNAVPGLEQRIVGPDGLGIDNVQTCAGELAGVQRVRNVLLNYELATGVVYEYHAVLHLGDALPVYHAGVFGGEVAV